jgi:dTDP-D-glucose 4,6-dehydratase
MIIVTGAAGFIGSNFVKCLVDKTSEQIAVFDNLTYASALGFKDRPGHDYRYATSIEKIKKELKWEPRTSLNDGLKITIDRIKNENRI